MSSLSEKRESIIKELRSIARIRRGQLSEQYYETITASGEINRQGPYYVWQATIKGKKRSVRIKAEETQQVREDIKLYARFKDLCEQLTDVTEQMTLTGQESKKKSRKPRKASRKK